MKSPQDPSELASALVDGALSAEEAARAAADPEVAALAEQIGALRSEMQDLPPAPDIGRANAVATAAAAAAEVGAPSAPSMASPPPKPARPWLIAMAGAAASVLLVLVAVGVVSTLNGDDDSEVTATAAEADEPQEAPGPADDGAGHADQDVADEEAPSSADRGTADESSEDLLLDHESLDAAVTYLGAFDDIDELERAVRDAWSGTRSTTPLEDGDMVDGVPVDCLAYSPAGDPRYGTPDFATTAVLDDQEVWVHLYLVSDTEARMVATDLTCTAVVEQVIDI